jgi:hypothetical protein
VRAETAFVRRSTGARERATRTGESLLVKAVRRFRAPAKWTLTIIASVTLLAWLLSGWIVASVSGVCRSCHFIIDLEAGQVSTTLQHPFHPSVVIPLEGRVRRRAPLVRPDPMLVASRSAPSVRWYWNGRWFSDRIFRAGENIDLVRVPLWPLIAAAAIPAGVLWGAEVRAVHRRRTGRCTACGYDRRGLPHEAPCPECGSPLHPSRPET